MGSSQNEYYDGSRLFLSVSQNIGIPLDQINLVFSQLVSLALAYLYRNVLHSSKTTSTNRHIFGLTFGLFIGYFNFGSFTIHLLVLPIVCYITMRTTNPEIVHRVVLAVSLMYLTCVHVHRQICDYGSTVLEITAPLMVITQKVTSLAAGLHDGLCAKEDKLTTVQKTNVLKKMPTPLEYFGYILQFHAIMTGPIIFYNEYMDFINGNHFHQPSSLKNKLGEGKMVALEPSPTRAVLRKLVFGTIFGLLFVLLTPMYNISRFRDDDFLEKTSLLYKFWYCSVATKIFLLKLYFVWIIADAIYNNSGIGFNGTDEKGSSKWDKFANTNFMKVEFATNLQEIVNHWNARTSLWLKLVVYCRANKYATLSSYTLSAFWHGFYPGYYLTFGTAALFTLAARQIRRTIRHYFTGNTKLKLLYDILSILLSRIALGYITFPFGILEFWPSIRMYLHMYLSLHLLALAAIYVLPHLVPPAPSSSTKGPARISSKSISGHPD